MFGTLIKIAFRNILRNFRRTLLTVIAVAIGIAMAIILYGIHDGMFVDLVKNVTQLDIGHVQVHHPKYIKSRDLLDSIPENSKIFEAIQGDNRVKAYSVRLYGAGLVGKDDSAEGAQIIGIDPKKEPDITEIHKYIPIGKYLPVRPTTWAKPRVMTKTELARDKKITDILEKSEMDEIGTLKSLDTTKEKESGTVAKSVSEQEKTMILKESREFVKGILPSPKSPPSILIGEKLAKLIEIDIKGASGQKLPLVYINIVTAKMETREEIFQVAGIYRTGIEVVDRSIYMHLTDMQRFFQLDGEIHEIVLLAADVNLSQGLSASLNRYIKSHPPLDKSLISRNWQEIKPIIQEIINISKGSMVITTFIIYLIIVLVIINTMLMAVFERIREFGVIKALGFKPLNLVMLIVCETLLISFLASIFGLLIGISVDLYLMKVGWDLTQVAGVETVNFMGSGVKMVLHAAINWGTIFATLIFLNFIALVGSFYPAVKAARLEPMDAIRTN